MNEESKTQVRIEGTYDPPNDEVQAKAEEYVRLLYMRMETQEKENVARCELIEAMREFDIEECEIDGYDVRLTHKVEDKIKVKKTQVAEAEE